MTLQILGGSTSQTVRLFIQDTSKTDGSGLTGLVHNTSGLTAYYSKGATGTATAITLATQTAGGAWTSGGFVSVDGTNMPGVYRLDLPNAALDSEVETIVMLRGAANMAPVLLRVIGGKVQSNAVTVADKTGYSLTQAFPANFASFGINSSGHVSRVTLVDTTTVNSDMRGTDNAALASNWTATRAGYLDGVLLAANYNQRTVQVTGSNHVAADIHELQPQVITSADFAPGAIDANALAADAVVEIRTGFGLASGNLDTQLSGIQSDTNDIQSTLTTLTGYVDTEVASIKSVTDKLNTGLVADGLVFQFTANMLELAPAAAGGGSATIENQELILDELDTLRSSFASAVGRLAVASQITGFPAALVRNSDYSIVTESEIRLSLNDLDGNPITEIGGVQCSEIEWLFGLGSERTPAIIEGAATWDDANNQLVIQIAADDTAATALGTLSWQIGCTIGTTTRYVGGGTTRLIERHF